MKYNNYIVNIILAKCKNIIIFLVENTKIIGDVTSHSLKLMLPASIYTKTASAATSSVGDASFESE